MKVVGTRMGEGELKPGHTAELRPQRRGDIDRRCVGKEAPIASLIESQLSAEGAFHVARVSLGCYFQAVTKYSSHLQVLCPQPVNDGDALIRRGREAGGKLLWCQPVMVLR